jgi:hypothetical protein
MLFPGSLLRSIAGAGFYLWYVDFLWLIFLSGVSLLAALQHRRGKRLLVVSSLLLVLK